ncbi:unnamed protein product [Acanthoscelides obtectus]|uniref:Uncharacterized protein n=1 Tax=Acanthoscelides obtectus TaxID=200917 RepID=A0A9P0PI30_ACAOB|nr:unnamed protein product [Acanthoscelides obtectus]CAK1677607.1 hypothetical protein AOBTE_LOCUS31422 [Acanthoscelides obtectus]
MVTCLPSMLPMQLGNPHLFSNSSAHFFHIFSVGSGKYICSVCLHIASQTSVTIALTVVKPTRKLCPMV